MAQTKIRKIFETLSNAKLTLLLLFLLILLFLKPLMVGHSLEPYIMVVLFVGILMFMLEIMNVKIVYKGRYIIIGIALTVALLAMTFSTSLKVFLTGYVLLFVFLIMSVIAVLSSILSEDQVKKNEIHGAVSVFILMGLTWGFLYAGIEFLIPGSFSGLEIKEGAFIEERKYLTINTLIYYSFVTITTLGYGDIVPVSMGARWFSILEALTGQLFLIVIVARLVGREISQKGQGGISPLS